jgi:hypothetical protein
MTGCLRPLLFVATAPFLALLAVAIFYGGRDDEAAKAAARAGKPPAMVDIAEFVPARDTGPANEGVLLAQIDLARMTDISRGKEGHMNEHYTIAPLYPARAMGPDAMARGVLVRRGRLSEAELQRYTVAMGAIGPVVKLDGELLSRNRIQDALEGGFGGRVIINRTPVYIDPYPEGRDVALAPSSMDRDMAFFFGYLAAAFAIGGIIGQFLLVRAARQRDGYHGSVY